MDRIARSQIIFDALNDEANQIAVGINQHRNKKVSLIQTKPMSVKDKGNQQLNKQICVSCEYIQFVSRYTCLKKGD